MLDSLFSTSGTVLEISVTSALLTIGMACILGMLISVTYMKTCRKGGGYSQNFALTLVFVPAIVAVIILLIGNNVARAFGLSGAFSIIRFRSTAGDPKDISYILFTMAAGLACGAGFYWYALMFTVILCLFMFILNIFNFGAKRSSQKLLKITIPEDLDYEGAFDEVLEHYTTHYQLIKVKTTDLGTLYELAYTVTMDDKESQKEFMDEVRCRNGNLNVVLSMSPDAAD